MSKSTKHQMWGLLRNLLDDEMPNIKLELLLRVLRGHRSGVIYDAHAGGVCIGISLTRQLLCVLSRRVGYDISVALGI